MKKKINIETFFFVSIIVVSVAFLLPLIVLSFYNHPSVDDFSYSISTHEVWKNTNSVFSLVAEAFRTSAKYYNTWQGLYSSAFLLSLQPSIFGESWYALAGIFIIAAFYCSSIFFCYYMFYKKLELKKLEAVSIGFLISMLCIQWMPSALQGIYWFNGAGNYTFFFAILLFVVVCITSISSDTSKVLNVKLCLKILITSIFAFILSGGNHVTAFMGFLTIATVVMYGFFRKNKMLVFRNLLPFAFSLFGLLLNFLSPGTKIRQSNFQKTGFVKTIVFATFRGFENTNLWINVAIILSILLMIPFFLRAAQRLLENGKCKFDKPLLVLILGAAYPCLEFCPPFYAVGHEGDGRLLNVVYFSVVFILFFEMFYIYGWFLSKIKVDLEFIKKSLQPKSKFFSILAVLFLCMTFFCACGRSSYGFQATRMILNGRAAQYDKEANERAKKAEESAGLDIQFKQFSVKPSLLFIEDLSEDSEIWPNIDYARFYNLKSVTLVE